MAFLKYQHIEKIGTVETNGIENGTCFIFPKIDGTNSSVWLDNNIVHAGSRNREIFIDNDNAGFCSWVLQQENIKNFLIKYQTLRLYGEWLVPHTLKTYREDAWRNFYIFDIMDGDEYIDYETYKPLLDEFNINYIPPICKIKNPNIDNLFELLDKNIFLIKDGQGFGEGIVIKNYNYKNRFGRATWAKIIRNEFKDKHLKSENFGVVEIKCKSEVEERIINKYLTIDLINKELSKIINESGEWSTKLLPKLFGILFYILVKEESFNFIKDFKYPVIDFKKMNSLVIQKVKELKPELL